jgi:hypothetical protein
MLRLLIESSHHVDERLFDDELATKLASDLGDVPSSRHRAIHIAEIHATVRFLPDVYL